MKDKIIEKIKNINWHVFHKRLRSPFFHHLFLLGTGIKKQDMPFDNRVRYFGSFLNHVAIDEAEIKELCDRVVRHLKKNPNYLLELMQQFYNEHGKCIKEWKKIATKSFTKESNEGLAKILEAYAHQLLSFGIYVTLPLFVEEYLEQTLMNAFTKRFSNKAKYWFNIAVDPIKDASVLQEELALLRLAQEASITKKELKKHAERFGWMKNVGYFEDYYDIDYYRSRLEEMRKNNPKARENKILIERAQHKEEFKKLTKTIAKDTYLLVIIKTANEAVYFRSYRTEVYYSSARFFIRLFKEMAKRLSIPNYKDILWLYWDEIYTNLRNNTKTDFNIIEERKQGYAFMEDHDGKYWNWKGKERKEVFKAFQQSQELKIKGMKELKGSSAFPGKVKGKVVVVLSADQQDKVQKGDILVTHATNVNFVPILNKVSAIVTEEGGILSHAAIISRELMIPCIIGTKIATKVLKDGDLVEVDANKGMIKKIQDPINLIQLNKWLKIFELEQHIPLFVGDVWMSGLDKKYKDVAGCSLNYYLYVSEGEGWFAFMNRKEIERYQEEGRAFFRNRSRLKKHIGKLRELTDRTLEFTRKLSKIDFFEKSNKELQNYFSRFVQLHEEEAAYTKFHVPEFSYKAQKEVYRYERELKNLIRSAADLMLTIQGDNFSENMKNIRNLLSEIRKRTNITKELFNKLTIKEIKEALMGGKVKKREQYIYLYHNGNKSLLMSEKAKKLVQQILKAKEKKSIFKGTGVTKGKVTGRALVLSQGSIGFRDKLKQVLAERIIITSMVRKDILPFIKKCKGVVTDEGGLTSHASILSRELKKPMVVATKDATLYIKNRDLVEIDAEKGIVRILKKSK